MLSLSKRALRDLGAIDAYTCEEWGEEQAERYLEQLHACFERLLRNPLLGRPCEQIRAGLRRIEQAEHVVFYRVLRNEIRVSRILHRGMLVNPDRFRDDA